MAFTQFTIDHSSVQSRGIFNNYVYRTTDTMAQVKVAGYFAACRFAVLDGPNTNGFGWNGAVIECTCSDGYLVGQINAATGTLAGLASSPALVTLGDLLISSSMSTQIPVALGTVTQVSFGALQSTAQFDLSAAGDMTCKVSGQYRFVFSAQAGRAAGAGNVNLFLRLLKNGVQVGNTSLARMDNAAVVIPLRFIVTIDLVATDIILAQMVQDTSGIAGAGGLYSVTPAAVGWGVSPSASVAISQLKTVV